LDSEDAFGRPKRESSSDSSLLSVSQQKSGIPDVDLDEEEKEEE